MKKPVVVIKNLQNRISLHPQYIKKIVYKTLFLELSNKIGQVSICLVDDKKIKELNLKYLGKDYPTDVLSFDLSLRKGDICCEIVVSCDTAFYNSRIYKTTAVYETYLYIIHGLLHILGYNDHTLRHQKIMREKAEQILYKLKVQYPNLNS